MRIVHQTVNASPVTTADAATVTTVHSWTPGSHVPGVNNCRLQVDFEYIGKTTTGGVGFKYTAMFMVDSGAVTILGSPVAMAAPFGTAGILSVAATLDVSGGAIRARVAGVLLTNIDWTVYMTIRSTELG